MKKEEVMIAVVTAAKEYAKEVVHALLDSYFHCTYVEKTFYDIESIVEWGNEQLYRTWRDESVVGCVIGYMSEDLQMVVWDMLDNDEIFEEDITHIAENYGEDIFENYIEELKTRFVEDAATNVVENNIEMTKMHLDELKEDDNAEFDLFLEIGNLIYNECGDGSDSYVEYWCNINHSKIKENFAEYVG